MHAFSRKSFRQAKTFLGQEDNLRDWGFPVNFCPISLLFMEHRGSSTASTSGRGLESCFPHAFTAGRCHRRHSQRLREFQSINSVARNEGAKSQAIAVSWENRAELEEYSTIKWNDSESSAQPRPDVRPASVLPTSRAKPLKINRDLLLVNTIPDIPLDTGPPRQPRIVDFCCTL